MVVPRVHCNLGFDNRTFLTEAEWRTYLRRKPVRYIRKALMENCEICGHAADEDNPFQNSHRISFDLGIVQLALTPEFLDGDRNIITAHRSACNKSAELDLEKAMRFLVFVGITDLPEFLPLEIRALWAEVRKAPPAPRNRKPSGGTR
jgi:hypothetical protein